jgi:hypothetical protein
MIVEKFWVGDITSERISVRLVKPLNVGEE